MGGSGEEEASAVIQLSDDSSDEKRVSSGDLLKVGPTGCANGLTMGVRREWSLPKATKVWGLNHWQDPMRQGRW